MARDFNGTSDSLNSASTFTFGSSNLAIAMWLYVNAFGNDDRYALEFGPQTPPSVGPLILPGSSSAGAFVFGLYTNGTYGTRSFTRPSSAAWHHYVFRFDTTQTGANVAVAAWLDGVNQTLTDQFTTATSTPYTTETLWVGASPGPAQFFPGRIAEVAIWNGTNISQTDVNNLYNGGAGNDARNVQNSFLVRYWQICGTASPEPALVGSVNLTVTGTTPIAHPISGAGICAGAAAPVATGLQDIGWMAMNPAWR